MFLECFLVNASFGVTDEFLLQKIVTTMSENQDLALYQSAIYGNDQLLLQNNKVKNDHVNNQQKQKPQSGDIQKPKSMDWKMQRFCSVFDTKERNLLLCGYIREEIESLNEYIIPDVVIDICVLYYDDVIYWKVEGQQLKQLRKLRKGKTLWYNKGEIIEHGIKLINGLKTSGKLERQNGFVQFLLSASHIPLEIEKAWIYVVLYCKETKYETRTTKIFTKDDNSQRWAAKNMLLADYKNVKSLTFGCQVKVQHIKYREEQIHRNINNSRYYSDDRIKIDKFSNYAWYIEGSRLSQFKNCKFGQHFYSPNFNHESFCIAASPKGWTSTNEDEFIWQIKLISLPYLISKIKIKLKMQCCFYEKEDEWGNIGEKQKKKYIQWFPKLMFMSYKQCRSGWTNDYIIDSKQIRVRDLIWCKVKIEIKEVYDLNGYNISTQNAWHKYGVIL